MEAARRAEPGDAERLAELASAAAAGVLSQRGGALYLDSLTPVDVADLDRADVLVVAGTIDDVVVGYAAVRLRTAGAGVVGLLDALFVEEAAREVGVGEAMMDLVIGWCGANGCIGVDAVALPGDRATKNFFERFGLTARAIVVHRRLTEP
jgi:GNAT superfamily N-acetyltransferase